MNLKPGSKRCSPEPGHQRDGHQQAGQGKNVGDPADGVFLLFGDKDEQHRARQRREKNDRENVIMHKSSRRSSVFSRRRKPCLLTALRNRKRIPPGQSPSPARTTAPGPTAADGWGRKPSAIESRVRLPATPSMIHLSHQLESVPLRRVIHPAALTVPSITWESNQDEASPNPITPRRTSPTLRRPVKA